VSCVSLLLQAADLLVTGMSFFDRFIILGVFLVSVPLEAERELCVTSIQGYTAGLAVILSLCALVEISVVWVSFRGTIMHAEPRTCMPYLVCGRLGKDLFAWFEAE